MKNLILTFHREKNYGAVLQAYALNKICNQYAYTETLDLDFSSQNGIKVILKKIIFCIRNIRFNRFVEKNFILSPKVINEVEARKYIDTASKIIVGSDQVWNKEITKQYYKLFLLKDVTINKISYAASIGDSLDDDNVRNELIKILKKYEKVSVRENDIKEKLQQGTELDISLVLDPTLLLETSEWNKLVGNNNSNNKKVVFYYAENNEEMDQILHFVKKQKDNKTIIFDSDNRNLLRKLRTLGYGPIEFIKSIKNADYIVTNSFHGLAFSIIFKKQFISILHKTKSERQTSLLKILGLEKRIYKNNIQELINNKIDYVKVDKKLKIERKKSINFLKEVLK